MLSYRLRMQSVKWFIWLYTDNKFVRGQGPYKDFDAAKEATSILELLGYKDGDK